LGGLQRAGEIGGQRYGLSTKPSLWHPSANSDSVCAATDPVDVQTGGLVEAGFHQGDAQPLALGPGPRGAGPGALGGTPLSTLAPPASPAISPNLILCTILIPS
jgi:hypothetical protein